MLFPYLLFPIVVQILFPSISCEQNLHHKIGSSNDNENNNKPSRVRRNDITDLEGNYLLKTQFNENEDAKETSDGKDDDGDEYDKKYGNDIEESNEDNYRSDTENEDNQNSQEDIVKMSGKYYDNDEDYESGDNDSNDYGDVENLSSDDGKLKLSWKHSGTDVEDSSETKNQSSTGDQKEQSSENDVTEIPWMYFEIDVKGSNKNGNKFEEIEVIEEKPSGMFLENDVEDSSGKSGSIALDEEYQNSDDGEVKNLQNDELNITEKSHESSAEDEGNEISEKEMAKSSESNVEDSNKKNESVDAKNPKAVLGDLNEEEDSEANVTSHDYQNNKSDPKENNTQVQEKKLGDALDNGYNDNMPSDYDQVSEKVNLEELSKECPKECPADETMVCSRSKHRVYRTFLSVCHMRMYACKHPEDRLELVNRQACLLSAPVSNSLRSPRGRLEERTDSVYRYLQCKIRNMIGKDCKTH